MDAKKMDEIVSKLEQTGVVPVIKLDDITKAKELAAALRAGGIFCAEVTFRAKGADKVISDIVKEYPDMLVGAGTVLTIEQAQSAISAGAKFLVAPGLNPAVVVYALGKGVPFIPGVSNASEVEQAMGLGLKHVKFFPAEAAGGLAYIKAISAPYPEMRFMPTGGVNESNICEYLANNKVFACGGSWMVPPELINGEKWAEITALSKAAVKKILGFELGHVGINCKDEKAALGVAELFRAAFGFENKEGKSSIFSSSGVEIMKSQYLGAMGHIAIKTNSLIRAMYYLSSAGFETDAGAMKYDEKGNLTAAYLKRDFGGFAVHIMQKK